MEIEELKKLLARFQRADYDEIVKKWVTTSSYEPLSESPLFQNIDSLISLQRKDFVYRALRSFGKNKPHENDIATLDLMYLEKYSKRKLWKVFSIQEREAEAQRTPAPKLFLSKLKRELKLYFNNVEVHMTVHMEIYWVRVRVLDGGRQGERRPPVSPTYLLHYPHTDHLLVSNIKAVSIAYIMQAFLSILGGTHISPLPLSGHCVQSLFQLVLHSKSQGAFSKFRLNQVDSNPLQRGTKRKRSNEEEEEFDCHIVNENVAEREKRKALLESTFGHNAQPCLEKVEYTLETTFKGHHFVPQMSKRDEVFHCKVRFHGSNVLEGIQGLAKAGLAELPMKDHVGKIPSLCKNSFLLRKRGLGPSQ